MAAEGVFFFSVLLLNLPGFLSSLIQQSDWNRFSCGSVFEFINYVSFKVNFALKNQFLCTLNHVRHLVSVARGRRYLGSRTCYCANSDSSFQQSRLLTSSDISLNPGPSSSPPKCSVCSKTIARNHWALSCHRCTRWCHIKCVNVKPCDYKSLQRLTTFDWICPRWLQTTEIIASLPRNESILTAVTATMNNNISSKKSLEDTFYVFEQSLEDKNLKIGHLNINGLVNKLCEVQHLLHVVKFDLLVSLRPT